MKQGINEFSLNIRIYLEEVTAAPEIEVGDVLKKVYEALNEKGYNPVNQLVGYIMSGDPTYITNHNNARSMIMKVERDELVEELMEHYIESFTQTKKSMFKGKR